MGLDDEGIAKPMVGVVSMKGEQTPCSDGDGIEGAGRFHAERVDDTGDLCRARQLCPAGVLPPRTCTTSAAPR